MNTGLLLVIILFILLIGAVPAWPYNRQWGYAPGGTLTVLLIIVLIAVLLGWL